MPADGFVTEYYDVMGPGVVQSEWDITVTSANESFYSAGNISWRLIGGKQQFDFPGIGVEGAVDITIHAYNRYTYATISKLVTLSFQAPMAQHYIQGPTEISSGGSSHFFELNDYSDDPYHFNIEAISGDEGLLPSTMIHVLWTGAMLEVRVNQELPFGTDVYIDLVVENPLRNHTHSYQVRVFSDELEPMNENLNIIQAYIEMSSGVPQIVTHWNFPLRVTEDRNSIYVEAFENAFQEHHIGEFQFDSPSNAVNGIETNILKFVLSEDQFNDLKAWKDNGYFVKIAVPDYAVQPSDEMVEAFGWFSTKVRDVPRNPSAPYLNNNHSQNIGIGQTDNVHLWIENPEGDPTAVTVTSITSSDPSTLYHKEVGFNSYGEYQLDLLGYSYGNVLLDITLSNGVATSTEQLMVRVTPEIQYHGTFSTEMMSEYQSGTNDAAGNIHVHINPIPWRDGAQFKLSAYSKNPDIVGNIITPNDGWNDLSVSFDTYMQGEAEIVITISDDLGTEVQRVVRVFVNDNYFGPGPGGDGGGDMGGGYCFGLCVSSVELEYEPGPGYIRMKWGEAVTVSTDGVLIVSGRIDGPSDGDDTEIAIPFQASNIILEGNDVVIPIDEQLKNELIEMEISHHDVEVFVPGNVFYSNYSGFPYNSGERIHFELSQGQNFELVTAHYSSLDGVLMLEFDGDLDTNIINGMNGHLKVGTGPSNFKSIYYSKANFDDWYPCSEMMEGDNRGCTSEIEIPLTLTQKELISSLGNKNGLYIHIDDGTITNTQGQPIVNSRFAHYKRVYYGTQFGDNWIESANLDINNNRIILAMDRPISSVQDLSFETDTGGRDSLFMIFAIDIENLDMDKDQDSHDGTMEPDNNYNPDYNGESSDDKNDGGDMPDESNPRIMFLRNAADNIVIKGDTVFINLSPYNKTKIENWKANFVGALLGGTSGFMVAEEAFVATSGETNVEFEHEATVLPFTNTMIDEEDPQAHYVAPPVVDVKTTRGYSYFECAGPTTWMVTVNNASIPAKCIIGDIVYLEKGVTYSIVAQDTNGNSAPVFQNSSGYPVPEFYTKSSGTAILLGFASEVIPSIKNATIQYTVSKDGEVVDSSSTYTEWSKVFFGDIGSTYTVTAAIISMDQADEKLLSKYTLVDTITVLAPTALTIPAEEWVMISNAGTVFDAAALSDIEYVYKWDDSRVESLLYSKYADKDELSLIPPGQAFWFLSEIPKTIPLTYSQDIVTVDVAQSDEGWNQLGNPYSFNLKTDAFGSSKEFFKWNGVNYQKVNYLIPGEGYLTYVNGDESIELTKDVAWDGGEFASTQLFKKSVATTQDWEMGIRLLTKDNKLQDNYNSIGVKPLAENSRDELDKFELPASMGSSVSLSFIQGDKAFRSEYKSEIEEHAIWEMNLGTTIESGTEALLEFDGLETVQSLGYSVYLVEGASKIEIQSASQVVQLSESKSYSLVVSEGDFNGSIAQSFASVSNFPNPVRSMTRFSIAVDDGAGARMYLQVFDVKGSVVFDKHYNFAHEIEWTPQSNSGEKLETGMYFYEITTGIHTVSNQMMILD